MTLIKVPRRAFRENAEIFEDLRDPGDRPGTIDRFVQLWLAAIAVSAAIAIWMFDYSIVVAGRRGALAANFALFGAAIVLYDLAHIKVEMRGPLGLVALLRLGLMALATRQLFTPSARAWFRGRLAVGE